MDPVDGSGGGDLQRFGLKLAGVLEYLLDAVGSGRPGRHSTRAQFSPTRMAKAGLFPDKRPTGLLDTKRPALPRPGAATGIFPQGPGCQFSAPRTWSMKR